MEPLEVTPKRAQARLAADAEARAVLIDVREPEEMALAQIPGAVLMPMRTVPAELQRLEALAEQRDLLIVCHHGARSLQVAHWLREQGIPNTFSIAGGIDGWSREVDSSIPTY